MNNNCYIVYDYETGGKDPKTCQLTQIAAIVLNPRTLRVEPNGIFNSEVQPIFDEEKAIAAGYGPVEDEALRITRKTKDQLMLAPPLKVVWSKFTQFVHRFNPTKSAYKAPIPVGYNIINYDNIITDRMCQLMGPTYKEKQSLISSLYAFDLLHMFMGYTDNNPAIQSRKLGDCMDWMGIDKVNQENAHDALVDVKNCANIFVKLLSLQREISKQTNFSDAFKGKDLIV